jgi:hypothetical protein
MENRIVEEYDGIEGVYFELCVHRLCILDAHTGLRIYHRYSRPHWTFLTEHRVIF